MPKYFPSPVNIMVDLETTGTKPGCHIASIGATSFGVHIVPNRQSFEAFATVNDERFTVSQDTMNWWSELPTYVRESVFCGIVPIDNILIEFASYLRSFGEFEIWGNSASFDLKILEEAYKICGIPLPWEFRQEMCYRTLKKLYPQIPYKKPKNGHQALADAMAQAIHAEEILYYKKAVEDIQASAILGIPLGVKPHVQD